MRTSKISLCLFAMLTMFQTTRAQVTDTIPPATDTVRSVSDSAAAPAAGDTIPTFNLPFLSDTIQLNDTIIRSTPGGPDTVVQKKIHSPRQAAIRSAILPGLGQIYNRKYWKVPIVYAGIGIPVYLFFDNKKWYDRSRYALSIVVNDRYDVPDSMSRVHPQLLTIVNLRGARAQNSLVNYRNEFRKNMDYSILVTLLMWGLNVVDATVDAHLAGFNVSDDLSMRIRPVMMGPSMNPGIALVLNFK